MVILEKINLFINLKLLKQTQKGLKPHFALVDQ
jgi:hypothetical protein